MSMFSQSLPMGDDTLSALEKPDCDLRPPESLGIIEESPTSTTLSNRTQRSRINSLRHSGRSARTQRSIKRNKSDSIIINGGEDGIPKCVIRNESYSELFRSNLDFDFEAKENVQPGGGSTSRPNVSLDKYFTSSSRFSCDADALEVICGNVNKAQEHEFENMFESSNFFSQPDEINSDEGFLDKAIVADKNSDVAWFEELNKSPQVPVDIPNVLVSATQDLLWDDCSFGQVHANDNTSKKQMTLSQNICWEDSGDFNQGILDEGQIESQHCAVVDAPALWIDNVSFTQHPQNPPQRNNETKDNNQQTSTDFIQHEMVKCHKQVSLGLAENSQHLGDTMVNLDISCTSNIVLNYSEDSVPIARSSNDSKRKPQGSGQVIADPIVTRQMPSSKNLNQIDQWGLSPAIVREYHRKGIRTMFDWQVECLSNAKVRSVFFCYR